MRILITGITGSLGRELLPLLLADGHNVVGYSRCELKQSQIPKHPNLTLYIGDVRNKDRLMEASRHMDLVFHLAALKRIDTVEEQPEEGIATNTTGTENLLFCQRMNHIPRVVLVSTDKACMPTTPYGATKFLAESLVLRNPNNIVCRYGNVLASRGSVVHAFVESLKATNTLHITDRECTRFWWTLPQSAQYVYRMSSREHGGLCIPNLKAYPVVKLGKVIAEMVGIQNPEIKEIGFRGREKLHEHMRTHEEGGLMVSSDQQLWFTKDEMKALLSEVIS